MENPVIVMQSRTVPDRITVMGELKDDNSVPVVAIVEVNPKNDAGKLLDMNLLNNAYGKNKKETAAWFNALGRSTPFGGTKFGLIRSISFQAEKSNKKIKASAVGSKKIAAGMTDSERANILRGKEIYAAVYNGQADGQVAGNKENFESRKKSLIAKTLEALQGEFNIPSEIANDDFDIVITTTSGLFHESGSKEITDAKQLVKLMPVLEDAVKGAVAIESHANRYYFDHDTVYFHNLIGGYIDGEKFVPIRFGVKQSMTGKNYLYVVIDSEAIKKAEVNAGPHLISQSMTPTDSAIINIAGVLEKVNSKDILKYIPTNGSIPNFV